MTNESARLGILALGPGEAKERELSWLDYSLVTDIRSDGSKILITESGEGGGASYSAYLRGFDGTPAVRLGDGSTEAFSPDGAWAIAITHTATPQIHMLPTSVGEPRALSHDGLDVFNADFLPDGKSRTPPRPRPAAEHGCTCATSRGRRRAPFRPRAIRFSAAP